MALIYKRQHEDGTSADPPTFRSSPGTSWNAGDLIHLGNEQGLRVQTSRTGRTYFLSCARLLSRL